MPVPHLARPRPPRPAAAALAARLAVAIASGPAPGTTPRPPRPRPIRLAALALALLGACTDLPVSPGPDAVLDVDLALPWRTATVADVGGVPELVARGIDRARRNPRIRSLLVVRDGRLVVEEYFGVGGPDDLHDVRSVTKSVVSALAGFSLARGEVRSLDDPVSDYIGAFVPDLDPARGAITIRHLLTMTSGLEWDESEGFGSYSAWIRSGDPLGYLLDQPFSHTPGTRFTYNSAAVHLLGVALEQASVMQLPTLAQFALFEPMGISRSRWEALNGGFYNGGSGIDLRPRDLARFGQLYLQNGSSGGNRILPAEWIELTTAPARFGSTVFGPLGRVRYGHLWWAAPDAPDPLYFAWGYGGQFVVVVPGLRLVAVATNDWRRVSEDGGAGLYERMTMDILVEDIIPAFR